MTLLNVLNAGLGLLSTLFVAYYFGTGRGVEVYFAAIGLHASIVSLAQTGQVSEVLLPSYHAMRQARGRVAAFRVYTSLTNRFLALLSLVAVGGWLLAPLLTALRVPGFAPSEITLAAQMFQWILPLVVLQVAAELLKTLANAERQFGTPELVSAAARVLSLLALVLLAGRMGEWALVVALWSAGLCEFVGILLVLRRAGYRYRLTLGAREEIGGVGLFSKLLATLPYVGATQVFLFILDAALSHLAQGSFALFRYASLIWSRTQGTFLRPVSVTFFTEFSEAFVERSARSVAMTDKAMARTVAIAAIVTTAVLAGAKPALTGLWAGERFPADQVATLVWLLGGLYVLLPFAGIAIILRKMAVSVQRVKEVYAALAVVQVFSAAAAWLLVPVFGLGGALLVSAFNMAGFCVAPVIVLGQHRELIRLRSLRDRLWRWTIALVAGVFAGMLLQQWLVDVGAGTGVNRIAYVAAGCVLAIAAVAVTFGVSLALRVPESLELTDTFAGMLSRRRPR